MSDNTTNKNIKVILIMSLQIVIGPLSIDMYLPTMLRA